MYGVSPAFFISRFGTGFGPADIRSSLPVLRGIGFDGFQAEIFRIETAKLWTAEEKALLRSSMESEGLYCSAFVGHFLGNCFSSVAALEAGLPETELTLALQAAGSIECGALFCVPLPAFAMDTGSKTRVTQRVSAGVLNLLEKRLSQLAARVQAAGLSLALELLPGNALGGSQDFLDLCTLPDFRSLRLLLDTGHFHVMGEKLPQLAEEQRIAVTHLCDNDGRENLSLRPGMGNIPLQAVCRRLRATGYQGSYDLEIICADTMVIQEYAQALSVLKAWLAEDTDELKDNLATAG
ncbi:MAG: sugar phosphate isomerase/epimerase [Spirochaetes bacterium]|nr:sugar phosphate isomerase/epimerase [Spirochaetota bacterium]MBU0954257.1 sugar phosphate isomerase/epimerase [Spirochaetota bacterium]